MSVTGLDRHVNRAVLPFSLRSIPATVESNHRVPSTAAPHGPGPGLNRRACLAALVLLLGACSSVGGGVGSNDPVVSGTVTYRERIALPADAVVDVALLDVSRMDVAATVLAEKTIEPSHQVPIPFQLAYDPEAIDPRMSYAVRATIRRGEHPLFITDRHYPVLTRGNGDHVDLVLVRSGGRQAPVADAGLTNTRWILRTLDGEDVRIEQGQRPAFLQFGHGQDDMVHGYAGCNTFRGGYTVDGQSLELGRLATTRRACPDMTLEDRLYRAFAQVNRYEIESTWLILYGPDGELATFEAWYE